MATKKKKVKESNDDGGSEQKSSKGGLVAKIGLALAVGVVSFGTVYMLPGSKKTEQAMTSSETSNGDPAVEKLDLNADTEYLEIEPITLSLQNNNRILKIGITLEVLAGEMDYIDPNDPKLRDAFTGYLRALRLEQIEDAAFMAQMRAQLLRRAQLVLGKDKIYGVLITDFLVR